MSHPDTATLERTVRFHAVHHYGVEEWSDEHNQAAFGALVESHGHDYTATVWVTGPMDPRTGFCADLPALDATLDACVRALDGGDLNAAVPEVADGQAQPCCEVLARWFHRELARGLPDGVEVTRVRVAESDDLAAWFPGLA